VCIQGRVSPDEYDTVKLCASEKSERQHNHPENYLRCIRVLEEQYIYDVMIGPGLMILIFEHKCFNLVASKDESAQMNMTPLSSAPAKRARGSIIIQRTILRFLEEKRCIRVLEEQYIYDVMIGPGLMILIFEHKCQMNMTPLSSAPAKRARGSIIIQRTILRQAG
jgi:hypothetical protein